MTAVVALLVRLLVATITSITATLATTTATLATLRARCLADPFDVECWRALCGSAIDADDYDLAILACGGALDLDADLDVSSQRDRLRFNNYVLHRVRGALDGSSCGDAADDEPLEALADVHRMLSIEELIDGSHRSGWALDHLAYSLQLGRSENGHATWPQYCALWRAQRRGWHNADANAAPSGYAASAALEFTEISRMHGLPQIPAALQPSRAKWIVSMLDDEFAEEARFLAACEGGDAACTALAHHPAELARVVRVLRALECGPPFISRTIAEWLEASAGSSSSEVVVVVEEEEEATATTTAACAARGDGTAKYHVENYSWGALFAGSFLALLRAPTVAEPMRAARASRRPFVVLGSNVGYEAFFASLGGGLVAVGHELLCHLVDAARDARDRHLTPTLSASVDFVCGDALDAAVDDAAAAYLDNDSWDATLTHAVVDKLWRELPDDALLMLWRYEASVGGAEERRFAERWVELEAVEMRATWSLASDRRVVRVLRKASF